MPGPRWTLEVRDDPSGRRGVWVRIHPVREAHFPQAPITRLELCAGREGDDEYVDLRVGQVITSEMLARIESVISYGREPSIDYGGVQPFRARRP